MCRLLITTAIAVLMAGSVAAQDIGTLDQRRAKELAGQRGWLTRAENAAGRVVELQAFERGRPRYYSTDNIDAADSVSTDECWSGGSGGLSLSGSGVTLGIWDAARVYNVHRAQNVAAGASPDVDRRGGLFFSGVARRRAVSYS